MSIALFRKLWKNLGASIFFLLLLLIPSEMKAIIRWAVTFQEGQLKERCRPNSYQCCQHFLGFIDVV